MPTYIGVGLISVFYLNRARQSVVLLQRALAENSKQGEDTGGPVSAFILGAALAGLIVVCTTSILWLRRPMWDVAICVGFVSIFLQAFVPRALIGRFERQQRSGLT